MRTERTAIVAGLDREREHHYAAAMQLEHIPWRGARPPDADGARRHLEREGFTVVRWNDAPGRVYTPHAHDHDESLWMVAGGMTFVIDGTRYHLAAGDRLQLPRGTVHSAEADASGAQYLIGER
jgi:quercetin dioxygenase-like cupin family protein